MFVVGQVVGAECWAYCLQNYVGDAKRCLRFFVGFQNGKPEVQDHRSSPLAPENSHILEKQSYKVMKVWLRWFFPSAIFCFWANLKVPAAIHSKKQSKDERGAADFFFTQTLICGVFWNIFVRFKLQELGFKPFFE